MQDLSGECVGSDVTISAEKLVTAHCEHCGTHTIQVQGGSGQALGTIAPTACLQCIADGGTCCSLAPLNRHKV